MEKFDAQKGSWIPCGRSPETGWIEINDKMLNNLVLTINLLQL